MGIPFWCWDIQIMSSWWMCWFLMFVVCYWCGHEYCAYFGWCEFLHVPIIVHDFVIVLFRILSRESAVIPTAIMELFSDLGVIGVNRL